MQLAPGRTRVVELDDTVLGQDRRDALDPELGRFLDDVVHAFTARDSLHEMDAEWRFGRGFDTVAEREGCRVPGHGGYRCGPLGTGSVEHRELVADAQSQDPAQVARTVVFEHGGVAVDQVARNQ